MKKISIKNIRKSFFTLKRGKVNALKSIDLEIKPGQFFVLLGPSGCGKSTLLNIVAGIEKPSDGEIWFGEQLVASVPKRKFLTPRERDVAMVFQSYALYPHMTIFENIAFPLKIAKMKKHKIRTNVERIAGILEITHLLEAKPAELSGGQRQRAALGRAIVRKPNVLLLDEPLSNLDALLRISMRSELKQIQRQIGVTTIYVTHDQTEAMSLGDCIAILKDGEIQQIGSPDEIYSNPQHLFVAKFMGSPPMNLLDGDILTKFSKRLQLEIKPEGINAQSLILGLRPEHLWITEPNDGFIRGKVNLIGSLGSEILLYVKIDRHEILVKVFEKPSFNEGDDVGIKFDPKNVFIFDKNSEKRIR